MRSSTVAAAAAAAAAALAPAAQALVGNKWSFTDAPADGLDDVAFPFNMQHAPQTSGFYFAQMFAFNNLTERGYCGVQPREPRAGASIVHAAFSSFQGGTTTGHANCYDTADGGPGVSCAVDVPGNYSHTYYIDVSNSYGTTWKGTLVDAVTGDATEIGEWTLPAGAGKLVNGDEGFVEYYTWNGMASHTCDSLPKTEATFCNPTSKTKGVSGGKLPRVYEYGECVGKAGYSVKKNKSCVTIKVGFDDAKRL